MSMLPPGLVPDRLSLADLEGCCALELRSFEPCDHFTRRTWRHLLGPAQAAGTAVLSAYRHERSVVAVIAGLLRRHSRVLRLYTLAVDPDWRRHGLALFCLSDLLADLPDRITTVSLEVRLDNQPARTFYRKLGFDILTTLPNYYPDDAHGLRLQVPLADLRSRVATLLRERQERQG